MQPWTSSQRVAVIGLAGLIAFIAIGQYAYNRAYVADPQPIHPDRETDLADRIDPNTADAATLSALPLIGDKKAQDIVTYRERYVATHPGKQAFRRPVDLTLIHGIGTATVAQLTPYLAFPETATTRPAEEK